MIVLLYLFTVTTRLAVWVLRRIGKNGTALPGLWVERYAPGLIGQFARRYSHTILITGTNGKTTTQHALGAILGESGYQVVHNASGSNMLRGIATTLMHAGPPHHKSVLLLEVEEGTMPRLTRHLQADVIVITNLFRDQLDAYGELHTTSRYIRTACERCPDATLLINGDDPLVVDLVRALPHRLVTYGIAPSYRTSMPYEGSVIESPKTVGARLIEIGADLSSVITCDDLIDGKGSECLIHFQPPGIYNVYNALAAYSVGRLFHLSHRAIINAIEQVRAPYGRGEKVEFLHDGKPLSFHIFLVKNPAGFGQVWQLIRQISDQNLIIGLNDQIADGRDVSWIWDIDLEKSLPGAPSIHSIHFTGHRSYDMATRFKYAEIRSSQTMIEPDITRCIDSCISNPTQSGQYTVLVTYTAMNHVRHVLSKYTSIRSYSSTSL
ncbi:MAG: MurT ligase domain-containing protein [Candidatus Roizmanbacteria bacterium]